MGTNTCNNALYHGALQAGGWVLWVLKPRLIHIGGTLSEQRQPQGLTAPAVAGIRALALALLWQPHAGINEGLGCTRGAAPLGIVKTATVAAHRHSGTVVVPHSVRCCKYR